ncbi:hypothetical protein ACFFWE_36775 [Sphaerisporangium melleum]|nr:hypothetical protein [Sphaerisporangium melleum]
MPGGGFGGAGGGVGGYGEAGGGFAGAGGGFGETGGGRRFEEPRGEAASGGTTWSGAFTPPPVNGFPGGAPEPGSAGPSFGGAPSGETANGSGYGSVGGGGTAGDGTAHGAAHGGTRSGPPFGATHDSGSFGAAHGDGPFGPAHGDGSFGGAQGSGSFGDTRGGSFEQREGGALSGRRARSRPFEDLGRGPAGDPARRPFETPAESQGTGSFQPGASGPRTGPFEQAGTGTGSFERAAHAEQAPGTGPFERAGRSGPASGSFERAGESTGGLGEAANGGRGDGATPPPPKQAKRSEPDQVPPTSRAPLFLAGGVLALIGVIVATVVVLSNSDSPVTTAAPSPSGPTAQAPDMGNVGGGKYGFAASRKTDSQPLALKEVFGRKKVTAHKRSYFMMVRRLDKKCKDAVHGTNMQKVLTSGKCTQLLRASFRDRPGKLIGTVGIANLSTAAAAKKAAKAGTGGELENYVKPLPGKDTATKALGGGGESYAAAWPQGHYLILLWFQYKDGHKPSKTELKALNQAAMDITEGTVFSALDTRALTGARAN